MARLKDKVCIITGATSGIGKRTAETFAAEGAKLVLAGRREVRLRYRRLMWIDCHTSFSGVDSQDQQLGDWK